MAKEKWIYMEKQTQNDGNLPEYVHQQKCTKKIGEMHKIVLDVNQKIRA